MRDTHTTTGAADRDFLARFEAGTLLGRDWNHLALLRVIVLLLRRHTRHDTLRRIRAGYRRAGRDLLGGPEGHHETLTHCWVRLVGDALARNGADRDFPEFIARHPELLHPDRVLDHYSPERIASARARREFVLPDRAPLPVPETAPWPDPSRIVSNDSRRTPA